MAKILVADDEESIRTLVSDYLRNLGHHVYLALDGDQALHFLDTDPPDLMLLDVMMPGLDGFSLAKRLLARKSVPYLFMSARTEEADRVLGLELGADDYISKPFSMRELAARIDAVLRRVGPEYRRESRSRPPAFVWKDLLVDTEGCRIKKNGQPLPLSAVQFQIFHLLWKNPGRVFSRAQILTQVRGFETSVYERTIDVHVKNLRKLLGDEVGSPRYIETVRGLGYRLVE